jgi:acyl-CoA thioesterase-1
MDLPTNYGKDYATAFADIYPTVADEEGALLVPGFVRELGSAPELLQSDGLHPNAEGQRRLAERLLPALIELIGSRPTS